MKKILICFLILITIFCMTGCQEENDNPNSNIPPVDDSGFVPDYKGDNMNYSSIGYVEGSIHQYNISELNDYVVHNSQTEYKVLIPNDASVSLVSYVSEFVSLFKEATNIELEVVTDNNIESNAKYISVGNTQLYLDSGVELNYN